MASIVEVITHELAKNMRDSYPGISWHEIVKYNKKYLSRYQDNLDLCGGADLLEVHKVRFKNGDGSELRDKRYPAHMKAIRSSSAFAVNLIGNTETVSIPENSLFPQGEYAIHYEEKGLTIHTLSEEGVPTPHVANIDVLLEQSNTCVYIEVKLLEPFNFINKKRNSSYTDKGNYSEKLPPSIINAFCEVFAESQKEQFRAFDACQMFKHLLGILQTENGDLRELKGKTIDLVNCHWAFEDIRLERLNLSARNIAWLEKIMTEYSNAKGWYEQNVRKIADVIEKEKDCKIQIVNLNHFEMLTALGKENNEYMQRYELR